MPWINTSTLPSVDIDIDSGSKEQFGALYYFEDIQKVLTQPGAGEFDPNRLVEINIRFPKLGVELEDITVMALRNDQGDGYLPTMATAWPPYYKRNPDSGTENFPGTDTYDPGSELTLP